MLAAVLLTTSMYMDCQCAYMGKGNCDVRRSVFEEKVSAYSHRIKVTDGGHVCRQSLFINKIMFKKLSSYRMLFVCKIVKIFHEQNIVFEGNLISRKKCFLESWVQYLEVVVLSKIFVLLED